MTIDGDTKYPRKRKRGTAICQFLKHCLLPNFKTRPCQKEFQLKVMQPGKIMHKVRCIGNFFKEITGLYRRGISGSAFLAAASHVYRSTLDISLALFTSKSKLVNPL